MKKYRLQIGLDVDDILYECNAYALTLLNRAENIDPPLTIHDIRSWGGNVGRVDARLRYFGRPEFVENQPVLKGAKESGNLTPLGVELLAHVEGRVHLQATLQDV